MITFACRKCGKALNVKDELAGKTGKCPNCKESMQVPAAAKPAIGADTAATIPPKDGSASVETRSDKVPAEVGAESYDFLAPPQGPDEIGRLGPYRVLKVLGAGGMGVVFQGEDPMLERKVALKAMLPGVAISESARKRFLREAKTAASFEHDHIVRIYQVGEDRGVPFIAMEFLKGEALDQRLKRSEPMPLKQLVRIGKESALGLAAAHKHGLVHRDIKPANLWLEAETERVKILDFGLARAAAGDNANITQSGAIMGTPAYMAPEQANGKSVDARTDLFSLGCVLYHICTGRQPFQGSDTLSTLVAVATHDPKPPAELDPTVPRPLSRLIMKLLAKAPDQRAASTSEVAEVLAEMENSQEIIDAPDRAMASPRKAKKMVSPSGTVLEDSKEVSKSLRDSIADEGPSGKTQSKQRKKTDVMDAEDLPVARVARGKKRKEAAGNPMLLWGLIGGGVGLVVLVGAVVAVIIGLNSGKGSSSGQQVAQSSSSTSSSSLPVSGPPGSSGILPPPPDSSEEILPPLPEEPLARAEALVAWPKPMPATWKLIPMKEEARLLGDRQQYYVTKFSKGLEGGAMLQRTSGDLGNWLSNEELRAKRKCTVYAVVRRRYLSSVVVNADIFKKLAEQGWQDCAETCETTSQGEDWQWKVLKRTAKKGEDISTLRDINWTAAVFFVVN